MHLGYVKFQEIVEGFDFLPEGERRKLLYEVFPRYVPLDYAYQTNFNGFKTFNFNGQVLFISRFFFRGEKDQWGRPVLEACIAAINFDEFNKFFRDIELVISCLDQIAAEKTFEEKMLLITLHEKSFFSFKERFTELINLIKKFKPDFLSWILGTIIDKKELIIPPQEYSYSVMKLIFAFLPKTLLFNVSTSSICTNPIADDRENIVVSTVTVERTKSPTIDFEERRVRNGTKNELIYFILDELVQNSWFNYSQIELFNFLIDYLDHTATGKIIEPTKLSEKLNAMKKTLNKTEELYRLLKKNLRKISRPR